MEVVRLLPSSLQSSQAPPGHGPAAWWSAPAGAWTEPDLHLFPPNGHRYEIIDGCLHVAPPPPESHEAVVRAVVATLRAAAPPGWWVCDRLGIEIGDSNVVPDVTVLRPRSSGAVWCDPDDVALVVEVETAATRRIDRFLKPTLYAEAGIGGFWRVEPGRVAPLLRTYELGAARYRTALSIEGAEPVRLGTPFGVSVAPATWV